MRKLIFSTCCAFLIGCGGAQEAPKTVNQQLKLSGVEGAVQPLLNEEPKAPSIIVGVMKHGQVKYYDFKTTGPQVDENSVFRIGSMTKPFTATLLATYVSDNTVTYDTAVNSGPCPEEKTSAFCFRGKPTTYQHLVQHTAELPTQPTNFESSEAYDAAALQDFLSGYQLEAEPGYNFKYSSTGYYALAMLLERRTNDQAAGAVARRVIRPLGLKATTFDPETLVDGFDKGQKVRDGARSDLVKPNGGLASTATDLMTFMGKNMNPESTGGLGKALEMTQRNNAKIKAFGTSTVTNGWFKLNDSDILWSAGTTQGYHGFMAFDRRAETAVVILTNTSVPEGDARAAKAAFQILADPMAGPQPPSANSSEETATP